MIKILCMYFVKLMLFCYTCHSLSCMVVIVYVYMLMGRTGFFASIKYSYKMSTLQSDEQRPRHTSVEYLILDGNCSVLPKLLVLQLRKNSHAIYSDSSRL